MFPPNYPFAPPAIRMHTPSGRFQPSQRLCLSISDFHPRSFNPAWEVSTILIGLLSFMTSDEMTTGSVSASEAERKYHAARSRWWNSTGGGSQGKGGQKGNIKAGDGGLMKKEHVTVLKEGRALLHFRAAWGCLRVARCWTQPFAFDDTPVSIHLPSSSSPPLLALPIL